MREKGRSLEDFPLHGEDDGRFPAPPPPGPRPAPAEPPSRPAAPLSARFAAAAADGAALLLLTAAAILAARLATGQGPRLPGIAWALGFLVFLSLFATVPPLVLFGRTLGMSLAELSARRHPSEPGLPARAALRRWLGTLSTAAAAGIPLLFTASRPDAPTPADRLSGHALTLD